MLTFWNITSQKLSSLQISPTDEKVIFVSDTQRLYVDFNGKRTQYRDIIYVPDINNIEDADKNKSSIYFDISTKKMYYYFNEVFYPLNPDPSIFTYIGKYSGETINNSNLNQFVFLTKGRTSKINDMVLDDSGNQWLKVEQTGTDEDWVKINDQTLASYQKFGLLKIKQNAGLKIQDGVLSLNLMDETRTPGQIVILNEQGKIDHDVVQIVWDQI